MNTLDQTHDPSVRSWLATANSTSTDFPIQNLPFCVFKRKHTDEAFRGGIGIGESIVDLSCLCKSGMLSGLAQKTAETGAQPSLNSMMAMGHIAWKELRHSLFNLLMEGVTEQVMATVQNCLINQSSAEFTLPMQIGDYTDFYVGIHHATTVGKLFRPDNPLLPNYKWVPIGYHGRASTIIVSETPFRRPKSQVMNAGVTVPTLQPTNRLDFELELGIVIGASNTMGESISIKDAENFIFGLTLLNDWSARDVQAWEYQPLGPFLSKNFASTISPWIVTMEALRPYRKAFQHPINDPQPLPYLSSTDNSSLGAIDIELEVLLQTSKMQEVGQEAQCISRSNFADAAYWTPAQLVTHHAIGGCALKPGDLLGTGTLSGLESHQAGSLLELTQSGKSPLTLKNSETRSFLEDGDTVILKGYCQRPGVTRIGFGICSGKVLASL
jgi:fumarylacetoacetase